MEKTNTPDDISKRDMTRRWKFVPTMAEFLTACVWFIFAYECDSASCLSSYLGDVTRTIPILKYTAAAVLTVLTVEWMPEYLLTRSVMGLFLLLPNELFKVTNHFLPDSGFAPVHIVIAIAYVLIVIGIYGLYRPWNVESAVKRLITSFTENGGNVSK